MKEKFIEEITAMMRTDSHSPSGNTVFTPTELTEFLNHLWDYLKDFQPIDHIKLTQALIQTRGYTSAQQQASRIIDLL
jgi:hypothetical protein